jgi:hypothetical protein
MKTFAENWPSSKKHRKKRSSRKIRKSGKQFLQIKP